MLRPVSSLAQTATLANAESALPFKSGLKVRLVLVSKVDLYGYARRSQHCRHLSLTG